MHVNQRLYLLFLLQSSGLQRSSLHLIFNALVINKLTYALPAYAGQLTADDKNRINAISRKAMRSGLTLTAFDIHTLIDKSDRKLFPLSQVTVCTIFSLLKPLLKLQFLPLCKRQHPYLLPTVQYSLFKIVISIVVYLNM